MLTSFKTNLHNLYHRHPKYELNRTLSKNTFLNHDGGGKKTYIRDVCASVVISCLCKQAIRWESGRVACRRDTLVLRWYPSPYINVIINNTNNSPWCHSIWTPLPFFMLYVVETKSVPVWVLDWFSPLSMIDFDTKGREPI